MNLILSVIFTFCPVLSNTLYESGAHIHSYASLHSCVHYPVFGFINIPQYISIHGLPLVLLSLSQFLGILL